MCPSGYHKIQWIHYNAQYTSMKCWRQHVPSWHCYHHTMWSVWQPLYKHQHVTCAETNRYQLPVYYRTKYNNLSFLENHSCVKITHATFIILKSFSVQYFSQKSWTSVIFNVWQCPLFLLTWRFLLESK